MKSWWSKAKKSASGDADLLSRNTAFARLWSAQALTQVAQNLLNFALIIRVFDLAQGTRFANISVAMVILAFGVPSIFFAAAAGVYVDHWNRKYVLVIANAIRAVLVLGFLIFEQNLAMVLLLAFLISSTTQFFAPAESASIPTLVGEKNLLRANSLFVFTLYSSFIVGYAGSAPVIGLLGPSGPYWLTSIMFAVATLLVIGLPPMRAKLHGTVRFAVLVKKTGSEVRNNWRIIRRNHALSFPILQLTLTQALVGVVLALAPALSVAVLKVPLQQATHVLIIPVGLGMVLGVIAVGQLSRRVARYKLISFGLVIAGTALMLLGLSGQLYRSAFGHVATVAQVGIYVAAAVLVLGFMNAIISTASQTMLQEGTTDETRGKVFGALNMMVNIAATAPVLFAGVLADLTSATKVLALVGAGLLVFAVIQVFLLRRRGLLATS